MSPIELAKAVYDREPSARSFREDLEAHLLNGHVFSTPTAFLMGRFVSSEWSPQVIVNPWKVEQWGNLDTFHIYLAAGDIQEFFTFPHKVIKTVSFERRNVLRFYPYNRLHDIWTTKTCFSSNRV